MTPTSAIPTENVRPGDATSRRWNRTRSSTMTFVSAARPKAIRAAIRRALVLDRRVSTSANTISGQCQRYHAYDTRPIERSGRRLKNPAGDQRTPPVAGMSNNIVPTTGTNAATPGYGARSDSRSTPTRIAPNPAHPATATRRGEMRSRDDKNSARSPAAPNSHARVGDEKNAQGEPRRDKRNDTPNESAVTDAKMKNSIWRAATADRLAIDAGTKNSRGHRR